jgi:predicted transcriptional regulator
MEYFFNELTQIRKQLIMQQSFINECVAKLDSLITIQINRSQYNKLSEVSGNIPTNKEFPTDISTKRGKVIHVLSLADKPKLAKEVKALINAYGEDLPNVDQTLVHLEKHGLISSIREGNRKKYFIKK